MRRFALRSAPLSMLAAAQPPSSFTSRVFEFSTFPVVSSSSASCSSSSPSISLRCCFPLASSIRGACTDTQWLTGSPSSFAKQQRKHQSESEDVQMRVPQSSATESYQFRPLDPSLAFMPMHHQLLLTFGKPSTVVSMETFEDAVASDHTPLEHQCDGNAASSLKKSQTRKRKGKTSPRK